MQAIQEIINACEWGSAHFFVVSSNVFDPLIYYSHLFPLIISLVLGIFIFSKSHKQLVSKVLFGTIVLLAIWLLCDLILWATEIPSYTMFFWSIINMVEPIIYAGILYFLYLFIDQKDISFSRKVTILILLIPLILLTPTKYALLGYDLSNCDRDAVEGLLVYYGYAIEAIYILWASIMVTRRYFNKKNTSERRKIMLVSFGSIGFLITFAFGNVIGSWFDAFSINGQNSWIIGQYGIFGVPIFTGFLAYLIVKYQTLNVKVIGTQVLVFGLCILIGSELFFVTSDLSRILVIITLLLSVIFSFILVKSVKTEIEAKERMQKLAADLEKSNTRLRELDIQKTEFISFATHQLRSPLTSIKGNTSLILEGDTGPIADATKTVAQTIYTSIKTMGNIVEDYLNMSRIELGTMKYTLIEMDFKDLLHDIIGEQKVNIEEKKLTYSVSIDESQSYKIMADPDKFKQVVTNTIDNSIKYTPAGSLAITLSKDPARNVIRLKIVDTGVGIKAEVMPKLFRKFSRAPDASAANIHGTGLGLFIAKEIMNAHHGKIWAESEGEGKGSQFYIEIPAVK